MMGAIVAVLASLLFVSVLLNVHLWQRWNAYRSRPAGQHSHTGMMPSVRVTRKNE